MPIEPPYPIINEALSRGDVIPFLGAGASLGMRRSRREWGRKRRGILPTGRELALHLARMSRFPSRNKKDRSELTKVAQWYHLASGRDDLNQELHSIFSRTYLPKTIHKLLASNKKPLLIVTTNYDTMMEQAVMRP